MNLFAIIRKTLKGLKPVDDWDKVPDSLTNFKDSPKSLEQSFYVIKEDENTFALAIPSAPRVQIVYNKPIPPQTVGRFGIAHLYSFNRFLWIPLFPGQVPSIAKEILFEASKTQIKDHVLIRKHDWITKHSKHGK